MVDLRQYDQNSADKKRNRAIDNADQNSGMSYGADRTLMTGQFGVVRVYVDSLDDASESDQEDAQQRHNYRRAFARLVSRRSQTERPASNALLVDIYHDLAVRCASWGTSCQIKRS
jgi:hypothetical protein